MVEFVKYHLKMGSKHIPSQIGGGLNTMGSNAYKNHLTPLKMNILKPKWWWTKWWFTMVESVKQTNKSKNNEHFEHQMVVKSGGLTW